MAKLASQLGFAGAFNATVDAKGRVALKASINDVLDTTFAAESAVLVASVSLEKSVTVQTLSVWQKQMEKMDRLPDLDANSRKIRMIASAFCFEVSRDSNNRLRIPAELREIAGIDKEVTVIGQRDHFQIWDRTAWKTFSLEAIDNMLSAAEKATDKQAAMSASPV